MMSFNIHRRSKVGCSRMCRKAEELLLAYFAEDYMQPEKEKL